MFRQDGMAGINSCERFILYRKFKLVHEPEKHLDSIRQKCFRDALVRRRLGKSDINVHKNRYERNDLLAGNNYPFCAEVKEEFHLCFRFRMYDDIRTSVIKNVEPHQESIQFARLMSSKDDGTITTTAWFVFKAFELRKRAVDAVGQ